MSDDFKPISQSDETALMDLIADAKSLESKPSDQLLSNILSDAAEFASPPPIITPEPPSLRRSIGKFLNELGGLPGASIITACALFGITIGYTGSDSILVFPELLQTGAQDSIAGLTDDEFFLSSAFDFSLTEE